MGVVVEGLGPGMLDAAVGDVAEREMVEVDVIEGCFLNHELEGRHGVVCSI